MIDVVTIGESMVLFTPESSGFMRYATNFSVKIAGAETNVAVGLVRLGHKAGWISRVGQDEFGEKMLSFIRGEGVDTAHVKKDTGASTGIYFKEMINPMDVRVSYYRKGSAASRLTPDDIDEQYLANAKFLHVTGITPALSDSALKTVQQAIDIAKANGTKIIFDPNIRYKLWPDKEQARTTLTHLASQADIVLPGVSEGKFLFGTNDPKEIAQELTDFGAAIVIVKLGAKGAYYFSENGCGYSDGFSVSQVVDPVGAGDGFAAGLISGLLEELSLKEAVRRACAVGAMVTMVSGDVEGLPDRHMLARFMDGNQSEEVNR